MCECLYGNAIRRAGSKTSAYPEDDIRYLIETVSNPRTFYTSTVDNEAESFGLRKEYLGLRQTSDLESGQSLSSLPLFARHDKGAGKKIKPITPPTIRNIIAERVEQVFGRRSNGKSNSKYISALFCGNNHAEYR